MSCWDELVGERQGVRPGNLDPGKRSNQEFKRLPGPVHSPHPHTRDSVPRGTAWGRGAWAWAGRRPSHSRSLPARRRGAPRPGEPERRGWHGPREPQRSANRCSFRHGIARPGVLPAASRCDMSGNSCVKRVALTSKTQRGTRLTQNHTDYGRGRTRTRVMP